jgi:hypothetical protein
MSRVFLKTILVLVIIGAIVGLGFYAYQLGVTQSAAQSAAISSGQAAAPVVPYYGMWYWPPFYGFGFLACLVPLFLLFLIFVAFRGLFWHGRPGWRRWHYGRWGYPQNGEKPDWKEGVPPMVAEWHRKLHEEEKASRGDQPRPEKV